MENWEKKFDAVALERGKKLFQEKRVGEIVKSETGITAVIPWPKSYQVTITVHDDQLGRMRCQCPKAKGGSNCEHMAAVLYSVYGETITEEEAEKRAREKAEAIEAAAQEEEQRRARELTAQKIAQREAEKAQKRAERKRRRKEAEEAARRAALEEQQRKEQEEKQRQEEEKKKAEEEKARRLAEAEEKRRIEQEKAEKRERKVKEAIERQQKGIEKEEQDGDWSAADSYEQKVFAEDSVISEDKYSYFDIKEVTASMDFPSENVKEGERLRKSGKIRISKVQTGYVEEDYEMICQVDAEGSTERTKFPMQILFSESEVRYTRCDCPQCRKKYYWNYEIRNCAYLAGLMKEMEIYMKQNRIGDATDLTGMRFMNRFHKNRASQVIAEISHQEETLNLVPRLFTRGDDLYVSFKTGYGKLYVVKDVLEFYNHVLHGETSVYGKNTQILHQYDCLTEKGKEWFAFIKQLVVEGEQVEKELGESWYYRRPETDSYLLYGWRIDQFYKILGTDSVEYEKRLASKKEKRILHTKEANPKIGMHISKHISRSRNLFHGVNVSCTIPVFYKGQDTSYFLDKDYLCRAEPDFMERVQMLAEYANGGELNFQIGREHLSEFYYTVLPEFEDVVDVMEEDTQEIQKYLPPEVSFVFYLDAEGRNITCRAHALYGETEVSVLDLINPDMLEDYRMKNREAEILHITRQMFPEMDPKQDCLHCGQDEELIYDVMQHGIEKLMELGEVRCTQRFRNMNVIKKVKLTAGVSVSGGLLNLEIAAEDISREELLDVLKSYRLRKTFYRMKNGEFLNLEDDTLEMLSELMETMHLSPKEFVKGKMHLPVYRTLYLDKLLEENENIYSTRDSHFRDVVKSFKTVNDADYEEPQSLSGIMRGYQKKGYRWLRTLEACSFGGILADDMGLGKTLQVIAVLLSASEEKRERTSLVVAPASLVFNWGEEFDRFAPQLKVLLVTGSQEERRKKLDDYQEYDVLVTSYDLLKRDIAFYEDKQFSYEIIDEAQYIKNHTTAVSKAVKVIHSQIRYALTGTPIENRLSELWSIFDYLMPGFLYSYEVFKREFETPIVKNGDEDAMKRLQKMAAPFILRRLKTDVLKDLPDKLEEIRYVKMDSAQQTAYDAQVVHMQTKLASQGEDEFSKNKIQILAELTRLRQICCDPSLCFENYKGESAKLESCLELILSAIDGGHKLLLFSQFTSMLEILEERLNEMGIGFYLITGATPKEKRLKMVKAFNEDDIPVFLISLKAGGVGLNLTGADVVIHYDPWWNLAVQNQATDRAHRIGQKKKVTVYKLIVKHSIEEKIQKLQEDKMDLAEQIVDAKGGNLGSMSKEDLLELLEV